MKDRLIIFDTTLRDGEQSPGASMTREEKLRIGRQLERMRVDVIEAGFPAASNGDFESVKAVAQAIRDSRVCGLARATDTDIRRAGEAVKPANAARIHTFIATSPIHMERKLRLQIRYVPNDEGDDDTWKCWLLHDRSEPFGITVLADGGSLTLQCVGCAADSQRELLLRVK